MRIAMVSEHASPLAVRPAGPGTGAGALGSVDAGGQNVHVHALAEALALAGHEVVVHTRRTDPHTPEQVRLPSGVVVDHVPAGPAVELPKDDLLEHMDEFATVLRQRWAIRRPDVAHAHFWMSGLAALDAGRALGVPVVQTFHALGSVKRRHQGAADTSPPSRVALESDLGASVDRVIATCADEVRELIALGVPATTVDVVPCGVDVRRFDPGAGAVDGRVAGPPQVLTVSRLVPRKGVDTAIRAIARVPGPAELVVAGGPEGAQLAGDPEVERLQAVAAAEGVTDRVRFAGRVGPAAVPDLMRAADVVVALPAYEPFGLVPLEAMAAGRPVVAARVGGLADTVVDGVTGLHVPPGDPDAAARAIATLLADPDRRERHGRAGRARVLEHYAWDRVAAATAAVYADVVTTAAAATPAVPAADLTGVRS
ncbi:glycosyltransferase [Actinomycetospora termitidis]|uniref:Glycosyltransferase n=1 Tax=Actinomycetospora termitidis TaxID=3053470 RepID=A0ABT7MIP7_9PSEU|nr:glycosyltransferase [Actinomycetospora sp. Odt1-22]MDL5160548.1 glycosyltransferase [Actinomycetospora sp. Odt1-22]